MESTLNIKGLTEESIELENSKLLDPKFKSVTNATWFNDHEIVYSYNKVFPPGASSYLRFRIKNRDKLPDSVSIGLIHQFGITSPQTIILEDLKV